MTLAALLLAFQETPPPVSVKDGGWVLAVVTAAVLFWREFTKSRAEREASQVAAYKELLTQQTANVATANASIATLTKENGDLKDKFQAEMMGHAECKWNLRQALKELGRGEPSTKSRQAGEGGGGQNPPGG